jgi:hypothetical protein
MDDDYQLKKWTFEAAKVKRLKALCKIAAVALEQ